MEEKEQKREGNTGVRGQGNHFSGTCLVSQHSAGKVALCRVPFGSTSWGSLFYSTLL